MAYSDPDRYSCSTDGCEFNPYMFNDVESWNHMNAAIHAHAERRGNAEKAEGFRLGVESEQAATASAVSEATQETRSLLDRWVRMTASGQLEKTDKVRRDTKRYFESAPYAGSGEGEKRLKSKLSAEAQAARAPVSPCEQLGGCDPEPVCGECGGSKMVRCKPPIDRANRPCPSCRPSTTEEG
jgi:hypothetical protein